MADVCFSGPTSIAHVRKNMLSNVIVLSYDSDSMNEESGVGAGVPDGT